MFRVSLLGKQSSSRDPRGPLPHDTTGQPDGHGRPDSHVQRDSDGYGPAELSVEEERHRYFWSDLLELYHAGHDEFRQRGTVYGSGQQHRRERDQ